MGEMTVNNVDKSHIVYFAETREQDTGDRVIVIRAITSTSVDLRAV